MVEAPARLRKATQSFLYAEPYQTRQPDCLTSKQMSCDCFTQSALKYQALPSHGPVNRHLQKHLQKPPTWEHRHQRLDLGRERLWALITCQAGSLDDNWLQLAQVHAKQPWQILHQCCQVAVLLRCAGQVGVAQHQHHSIVLHSSTTQHSLPMD
jgi:hypothetical protein